MTPGRACPIVIRNGDQDSHTVGAAHVVGARETSDLEFTGTRQCPSRGKDHAKAHAAENWQSNRRKRNGPASSQPAKCHLVRGPQLFVASPPVELVLVNPLGKVRPNVL